jgi:Zn finger protein HypA/HybF involved in hydrogenase expression
LKINTDHWTGSAWNKDQQLKDYSDYTKVSNLKPHLIKQRGHKCEECKRTKWFNKPITLEIHHNNGDRTNNSENNLTLLCPNCHSYTDRWRNRK